MVKDWKKDDFITYLKELSNDGKKIIFRPNLGNAGDALINVGFYEIATKLSLKYKTVDNKAPLPLRIGDHIMLMSGGGNLVEEWPGTYDLLANARERSYNIVMAPQSVTLSEEKLKEIFIKGDVIFCREHRTFERLQCMDLQVDVYLAHDLAFWVNVDNVKRNADVYSIFHKRKLVQNLKRSVRLLLVLFHYLRSMLATRINANRTDSEGASSKKFDYIFDISRLCQFDLDSRVGNYTSAYLFLATINFYQVIKTNRLHIMIASYLLDKEFSYSDNSYGKLSAVYDYSIKE